jgi:sulfatase maturation enzyme AslB (radical SAM superfamily)
VSDLRRRADGLPRDRELIDGVIERKKHAIMCTNALLLDRFYKKGRPHKRLTINVHLDGMRETHDRVVDRRARSIARSR